jgi:hypothetical protein
VTGGSPGVRPTVAGTPAKPGGGGLRGTLGRMWGTAAGRRTIVIGAIVLALLVVLGVSIVMFSSLSREPQSYKDGYSTGGSIFSSEGSTGGSARQACTLAERGPSTAGGLPSGDDPAQWIKGCIAAYDNAEADS